MIIIVGIIICELALKCNLDKATPDIEFVEELHHIVNMYDLPLEHKPFTNDNYPLCKNNRGINCRIIIVVKVMAIKAEQKEDKTKVFQCQHHECPT